MQLKGKTVYMTGGTGGIGKPLVSLLKKEGATIILYDRQQDGDLAKNIESVCNIVREVKPDILINMAGFNDFNYAEDQDYDALIALNMLAPMKLAQAALPSMRENNSGHIVNVGSMTALIPLPHITGYSAAKAGLKAFNDALRRELSGTGITVTHIVPRAVRTGMNTGTRAEINEKTGVHHDDPQEVAQQILDAIKADKRELRIGWPERLFAFLNAIFPAVIDQGLQKNCKIGEEILNREKQKQPSAPRKAA